MAATMPPYAGLRQWRRAQQTGSTVAVYDGIEAGFDTESGRWSVVCETHGAICSFATLALARFFASSPVDWCEDCGQAARQTTTGGS